MVGVTSVRLRATYRPRYGFGLWIGLTVLDPLLIPAGTRLSGMLSLTGFLLAFAWAQGGIPVTSGERVDTAEDGPE